MYTINYTEKIFLSYVEFFDSQTNTIYISQPQRTFYSKKELISFLADNIRTHGYMDSSRWDCDYFNNLNINGSDLTVVWNTVIRNERIIKEPKYYYRLYYFYDSSGRVIDVRKYKDKVFHLVYARLSNLTKEENFTKINRKRLGISPTSHTCTLKRKNARYIRTARLASIPEYKDYIPADEKNLKRLFYDDFWGRGECSWKRQYKCRHQWEKHLK